MKTVKKPLFFDRKQKGKEMTQFTYCACARVVCHSCWGPLEGLQKRWGEQRGFVVEADPGQEEKGYLLQCLIADAVLFHQYQGL